MPTKPSKEHETFPNPAAHRDFRIHMDTPDFADFDSRSNIRG